MFASLQIESKVSASPPRASQKGIDPLAQDFFSSGSKVESWDQVAKLHDDLYDYGFRDAYVCANNRRYISIYIILAHTIYTTHFVYIYTYMQKVIIINIFM